MPTFHSCSSFIITISTLSPLSLTLTLTLPSPEPRSETLQPRKEVFHNIWCGIDGIDTPPPPDRWPLNVPAPRSTYTNLEDLCRFDRSRPNVGCLCDSPYVQVECRRELAHPLLYTAFLPDCAEDCYCMYTRINPLDTTILAVEAGGRRAAVPFTGGQRSDPGQAAQAAQAAQRARGDLRGSHSD